MLENTSGKLVRFYANIADDMGWYGKSEIQAVTLKRKPDTWLLIVKVRKKGIDWVCFAEAETIDDALRLFHQFCTTKNQTGVRWTKSQY